MCSTEKMRRKEVPDRRADRVFPVCQEINMMEMNVSKAHCLAAMGGLRLIMYVSVRFVCARANYMHAPSSKSDCQSDMCSPLSEGGAQTESSGSVREMKIWTKFKRKQEALIKRFLFLSEICVSICVRQRQKERSSFAMTIYPLLSRCRLTCCTLPTSASLWFSYSIPPLTNKGKEVSFS